MDEFKVLSPIGMWDVAREVVARLSQNRQTPDVCRAAILALSGELGAGKTTFTQALAGILGAPGPVQSPTYVVMKKHPLKGGAWRTLAHIDAYRLRDEADLSAIAWQDLVSDPANLIVLEWPERVAGALPADALWLRFSHDTPETRVVRVG